jgi:hypothetical protein
MFCVIWYLKAHVLKCESTCFQNFYVEAILTAAHVAMHGLFLKKHLVVKTGMHVAFESESGSVVRSQIPIPKYEYESKQIRWLCEFLSRIWIRIRTRKGELLWIHIHVYKCVTPCSTRTASLMVVKTMSCRNRETLSLQFIEKHSGYNSIFQKNRRWKLSEDSRMWYIMCVCLTLSTHVCESVYVCSVSYTLRSPTHQGVQEWLVSYKLDHSPYHTTRRTVILLCGWSVLGDVVPQHRRVSFRQTGVTFFFPLFFWDPLGRGGTRRSRIRIRIRTCSKFIIPSE